MHTRTAVQQLALLLLLALTLALAVVPVVRASAFDDDDDAPMGDVDVDGDSLLALTVDGDDDAAEYARGGANVGFDELDDDDDNDDNDGGDGDGDGDGDDDGAGFGRVGALMRRAAERDERRARAPANSIAVNAAEPNYGLAATAAASEKSKKKKAKAKTKKAAKKNKAAVVDAAADDDDDDDVDNDNDNDDNDKPSSEFWTSFRDGAAAAHPHRAHGNTARLDALERQLKELKALKQQKAHADKSKEQQKKQKKKKKMMTTKHAAAAESKKRRSRAHAKAEKKAAEKHAAVARADDTYANDDASCGVGTSARDMFVFFCTAEPSMLADRATRLPQHCGAANGTVAVCSCEAASPEFAPCKECPRMRHTCRADYDKPHADADKRNDETRGGPRASHTFNDNDAIAKGEHAFPRFTPADEVRADDKNAVLASPASIDSRLTADGKLKGLGNRYLTNAAQKKQWWTNRTCVTAGWPDFCDPFLRDSANFAYPGSKRSSTDVDVPPSVVPLWGVRETYVRVRKMAWPLITLAARHDNVHRDCRSRALSLMCATAYPSCKTVTEQDGSTRLEVRPVCLSTLDRFVEEPCRFLGTHIVHNPLLNRNASNPVATKDDEQPKLYAGGSNYNADEGHTRKLGFDEDYGVLCRGGVMHGQLPFNPSSPEIMAITTDPANVALSKSEMRAKVMNVVQPPIVFDRVLSDANISAMNYHCPGLLREDRSAPEMCRVPCPLPVYTFEQWNALWTTVTVVAGLAFFAAIFTVLSLFLVPEKRTFPHNIPAFGAIAALVVAAVLFFSGVGGSEVNRDIVCMPWGESAQGKEVKVEAETELGRDRASASSNFTEFDVNNHTMNKYMGNNANDAAGAAMQVQADFNHAPCVAQGVFLHYFMLNLMFWWLFAFVYLYATIVLRKSAADLSKTMYKAIAFGVSYGVPLVAVIIVLAARGYEAQGAFCFADGWFAIGTFWIPTALLMVVVGVLSVRLVYEIVTVSSSTKDIKGAGKSGGDKAKGSDTTAANVRIVAMLVFVALLVVLSMIAAPFVMHEFGFGDGATEEVNRKVGRVVGCILKRGPDADPARAEAECRAEADFDGDNYWLTFMLNLNMALLSFVFFFCFACTRFVYEAWKWTFLNLRDGRGSFPNPKKPMSGYTTQNSSSRYASGGGAREGSTPSSRQQSSSSSKREKSKAKVAKSASSETPFTPYEASPVLLPHQMASAGAGDDDNAGAAHDAEMEELLASVHGDDAAAGGRLQRDESTTTAMQRPIVFDPSAGLVGQGGDDDIEAQPSHPQSHVVFE